MCYEELKLGEEVPQIFYQSLFPNMYFFGFMLTPKISSQCSSYFSTVRQTPSQNKIFVLIRDKEKILSDKYQQLEA